MKSPYELLENAGIKVTHGRVEKLRAAISKFGHTEIKFEIVHHGGNAHRLAADESAFYIGSFRDGNSTKEIWALPKVGDESEPSD
jgi:hypothetical protein